MNTDREVKYSELVDVHRLQALMESFNAVVGIANAVIDVDGDVIAHAGWQDACTDFHRVNPETCRRCIASDTALAASMTRGEQYAVYECLNGLVDTAAPIVVDGRHVANVFTGQFLTRAPDLAFFRQQARQAGFDEAKYLAAIARVPIVPRQRVEAVTRLYAQLAAMLADSGMDRLRQQQTTRKLARLNDELEARVVARTEALSRSEARLRAIIDASPVPQLMYGSDERITYVNAAFTRCFGYPCEEIPSLGEWWSKACPDAAYRAAVGSAWQQHLAEAGSGTLPQLPIEVQVSCRDGDVRTVQVEAATAEKGGFDDVHLLVFFDLTAQRRADAALQRQKEYLQAIIETEPECVKVVSPNGVLEDMNPAGLRMLEVDSLAEARRRGLLSFVDAEYRDAFGRLHASVCAGGSGVLEFPVTGAKGARRWLETHAAPLRDENGKVTGLLGVTRDITERKAAEEAFRQMAFYDRLTGLPNRRLLEDRLQHSIARARREHQGMSLLFIDLDRFKPVNDEFGHATGDWLLQRVAERMQQCLRQSDTVARVGGDEFVVLLPDAATAGDAVAVAEKIRLTLTVPFVTPQGRGLAISSSIGVVLYPDHADDPRDLLRLGDEAMYRAKKSGRNAVAVFAPAYAGAPLLVEGRVTMRLRWKAAYACGEPTIDREHRGLFRRANILLDRVVRQKTDPESFNEAFDALLAQVAEHFAHEEEILRAHAYPAVDEHAAEHRLLLERASQLRRQSEDGALPAAHLVDFLVADIVAGHMLGADSKFRGLFAKAGAAVAGATRPSGG